MVPDDRLDPGRTGSSRRCGPPTSIPAGAWATTSWRRPGGLNDPNGLCWFAGEYHVFYQHNPYSTEWGPIHWGHVVSPDLVHWRHAGVALAPGDSYDRHGCHSGSAVDNDGELTLIYTGHVYADPDPLTRDVDQFTQTQNIAVSRDGTTFVKYPGNPVLARPPADSTHHFRDPKVWRHEDHWYMVLGNGALDGAGRALLYRSYGPEGLGLPGRPG